MFLTNEWHFFEGALDKKTCNRLIELGNKGFEKAVVAKSEEITAKERVEGKKEKFELDEKKRESDVAWSTDQWVYDLIWPYMGNANEQTGWKYDIKAAESFQITRYKKGGFYGFHTDGRSDHLSAYKEPENKFLNGHVRKLSMSILLNDDYEGGGFEFARLDTAGKCATETTPSSKVGSIIVFPSFMMHRVKPVTKGTRYSLVTWFVGPPFK